MYSLNKGAIAPFGFFTEIGINANRVKLQDATAFLDVVYRSSPAVLRLETVEDISVFYDLGVNLYIGEKRYLENYTFLEYYIGIDINSSVNRNSVFNSHMDAAIATVKMKHLNRSFFHLNFIYGFGF